MTNQPMASQRASGSSTQWLTELNEAIKCGDDQGLWRLLARSWLFGLDMSRVLPILLRDVVRVIGKMDYALVIDPAVNISRIDGNSQAA